MKQKFVYSLDEITSNEYKYLGGKAGNLAKTQLIPNILQPKTLVLTSKALNYFIENNFTCSEITELVKDYLLRDKRGALFAKIAHSPFPSELEKEILDKIPPDNLMIIRSSGVDEDSTETSLAGHYESIITGTNKKDFLHTVKTCWNIAVQVFLDLILEIPQNPQWDIIAQRAFNSIALVFQEVINSEKSGVYFGRSPIIPDRQMIAANYGTCHSVVDGRMAVDTYTADEGVLESCRISYKFEMTSYQKEKDLLPGAPVETPLGTSSVHFPYGGYLYSAKVPAPYGGVSVLNKEEIAEIHKLGQTIKEYLQYEADVEWSYSKGRLYLLQCRPITGEPPAKSYDMKDCRYLTASPGIAQGPVKIVLTPQDIYKVNQGDIIAVEATDPDFMPIIYRAAGIISGEGSPLCHTAIVARELKIPCIMGVEEAVTGAFYEGEIVTLDADNGRILREDDAEEQGDLHQKTKSFKRNNVIYDVNHLKFLGNKIKAVLAASALLHDFYFKTKWADPKLPLLLQHIKQIKDKYSLQSIKIHWDVNDHINIFAERDKNLSALYELSQKGEF